MTTSTLTLTDFLLARIAEDEGAARAAYPLNGWRIDTSKRQLAIVGTIAAQDAPWRFARLNEGCTAQFIVRNDPARVLAECEAKRRIVNLAVDDFEHNPNSTLRILAAVYADHPDYRDEWR